MVKTLVTIRTARETDAEGIAEVHDAAWREAYLGVIPGRELEKMVARRGPHWWLSAIKRGSRLVVLDFDETIAGYASYGRNRLRSMPYAGEIFELYLAPEFQGLGFGKRLFEVALQDLADHGYGSTVVWALADNDRAMGFYRKLGGKIVRQTQERFGGETRERVAFAFE
ncbi:GNAT family N-acetyltransferase [Methyloferula stellata]|jgi:ribosomal protein S18 acetylase RimI-like enzyme|uniref:GNAT family N-acetyltransferase n=1 Tax=Methyloferula stellata TaxID=876270 RepID=UPI000378A533|nr:GNAT family N-acetyltransferase [Methyloferula stellata]